MITATSYGPLSAEGRALGTAEATRRAVAALSAIGPLADFGRELAAGPAGPGRVEQMIEVGLRRARVDVMTAAYLPAVQTLMRLHGAMAGTRNGEER